MGTDEVLTLKEVALLLKIAERTAYMMVQRGDLPGFKVGGQWRFRREDIDARIGTQTADAVAGKGSPPSSESEETPPRGGKGRKAR